MTADVFLILFTALPNQIKMQTLKAVIGLRKERIKKFVPNVDENQCSE